MEAWLKVMGIIAPLEKFRQTPPNCFGIFVTWYNGTIVHGCVGKYNLNFKRFYSDQNTIPNLSLDSAFQDSRKTTNTPWNEKNMMCEVSFMIGPVKIKPGNPDKTGIVVVNGDKTATFLPNVFSNNTSWNYIKKQLLIKANLENGNFYYYKTKTIKITYSIGLYNIGILYAKNLLKIPIKFNDPYDNVRNASFVVDLLNYNKKFKLLSSTKVFMLQNLLDKFKKNNLGGQVNAFLALGEINTCARLRQYLPKAEKVFELGQISLALIKKCKNNSGIKIILNQSNTSDIFQANWYFQALHAANMLTKKHELIAFQILQTVNEQSETNYIAVGIELASQFKNLQLECIRLLRLISYRVSTNYLFAFKNGETRVDITTHVINGLLC